jgi:hypothetical protein
LPFTGRLAPFLWWSLGAEALGTQRDDRPKGVQILRRAASVGYQDDHRETAKLNGKQRENLGGKERDPLQKWSGVASMNRMLPKSRERQKKMRVLLAPLRAALERATRH